MKKIFLSLVCISVISFFFASCGDKKKDSAQDTPVVEEVAPSVIDTAYYGVCGEGTSMHSLELVTDEGKKVVFVTDEDQGSVIIGGLYGGDRITVSGHKTEDGMLADRVINLTTVLGKWISLDRNFEIKKDGSIESAVTAESRPYTAWSMVNTNLILNADTFAVLSLGPDSMSIENNQGIFVYKRQK